MLSLYMKYMMLFSVTVEENDYLRRKISFVKTYKSYVCHRRHDTTLL